MDAQDNPKPEELNLNRELMLFTHSKRRNKQRDNSNIQIAAKGAYIGKKILKPKM